MQYERVKTFFSDIESQGWKVAVGGNIEKSQGYFITPTIIDRPPEKSRLVVEEPFGKFFDLPAATHYSPWDSPLMHLNRSYSPSSIVEQRR